MEPLRRLVCMYMVCKTLSKVLQHVPVYLHVCKKSSKSGRCLRTFFISAPVKEVYSNSPDFEYHVLKETPQF